MTMLKLLKINLKDEQVEKTLSVILRVPGLFLLDHWCQSSYTELLSLDSQDVISAVISPLILIQSLLLLLLPLEDLVTLYMHYLSAGLIAGAEFTSRHYVLAEQQTDKSNHILFSLFTFGEEKIVSPLILNHFTAIAVHVIVATVVSFLMDVECNVKKAVFAVYAVPVAAKLAHFPLHYLEMLHNFSSALIIFSILYYSLTSLPSFLLHAYKIYRSVAYALFHEGPLNAAFGIWDWFFIMQQFLVFWCILVAVKLHNFPQQQNPPPGRLVVSPVGHGEWYLLVLFALSDVCTSPVSLLGCCITVMYTSRLILTLTKAIARGTNGLQSDRELNRSGITEGVTMALLAVQTGLIDLPMPQRMGAMCIILFIVVGSLVQSMHEIVEPILLALSASHSKSIFRHVRVVGVSLFLLVFPLYMAIFLCRLFDVDFWALVVISTCTLTSIQVLGAMTTYGLFLYDAFKKNSDWEDLDDIVYYTRAIIRVLEFLVAVLVVGAGVRESMLLSLEGHPWSILNSSVLAVHCYYNVYLRLQNGWHSFLLRREAARKIHSLPCANEDQIESHSNDICAICHVEMKTACVTPCNHLFHAACLKKWFYIQDRCPLCFTKITTSETGENIKVSSRDIPSSAVTQNVNAIGDNSKTADRDASISSEVTGSGNVFGENSIVASSIASISLESENIIGKNSKETYRGSSINLEATQSENTFRKNRKISDRSSPFSSEARRSESTIAQNCEIADGAVGLEAAESENTIAQNSKIADRNCTVGVKAIESESTIVENNKIPVRSSPVGLEATESENIIVENSKISNRNTLISSEVMKSENTESTFGENGKLARSDGPICLEAKKSENTIGENTEVFAGDTPISWEVIMSENSIGE